jgi:hypothetical protein
MGWVRIDDTHADHPKLIEAGPMAELLDVRAICWSARFEQDGRVPRAALVQIGRGIPRVQQHANRLVKVGRWRKTKAGWNIVGFLDTQPSKADRESERARAREYARRTRARASASTTQDVTDVLIGEPEPKGTNRPKPEPFEPEPAATNGQKRTRKKEVRALKDELLKSNGRRRG